MRPLSTLADVLLSAEKEQQAPALLTPSGCKLHYGHVRELVGQIQSHLGPHASPNAVVSLLLPNSVEFVLGFLAVTNLGCAAAPLNPNYGVDELLFYLEDARSSAILVPCGSMQANAPGVQVAQRLDLDVFELGFNPMGTSLLWNHVRKSARNTGTLVERRVVDPHQVALLLHTSGTTSKPKCVPLTHANIVRTMSNIQKTYQLSPSDRTLVVMPLFHVHGLIGALLSTLGSGGSAVIPNKFSATTFWTDFDRLECSWYSAVPTIHQILLRHEDHNPSAHLRKRLRFIRSCSAALAPATLRSLEQKFSAPVLEAYAMTEAAHQMTSNPLPPAVHKPGSVGIGQGVDIAILDDQGNPCKEGEVCIRGSNVTSGYLHRPQANVESFTRDGWFRTGDRGYLDADGYLFLTGRLKELINRGGEKISPLEVDAALLEHEAVAEAVSFGAPNELYGEEVHAAVILREGASVSAQALMDHCRARLIAFKAPKEIYFTHNLPRTATGKIQRRIVASHFLNRNGNKTLQKANASKL